MVRRLLFATSILMAAPSLVSANELSGRYAYYLGETNALQDRGPRNDADCRAYLSSDLFRTNGNDILDIGPGRWEDNSEVPFATGNVRLGTRHGNTVPFTIRLETDNGIVPAKGRIIRRGQIALTIAMDGRPPQHYCRQG